MYITKKYFRILCLHLLNMYESVNNMLHSRKNVLNFCQWFHFMYKYMGEKPTMNEVFYKYYGCRLPNISSGNIFFYNVRRSSSTHLFFANHNITCNASYSTVLTYFRNKKNPSFKHQLQTKFFFTIRKNLI